MDDVLIRTPTRSRFIGCECLEFIKYVSEDIYGDFQFIGRRGIVKAFKIREKQRGGRLVSEWVCPSLPLKSKVGRGLPISSDYVRRLKIAAKRAKGKTPKRDGVLISVLEQTGGRCDEVNLLKASDIVRAFESGAKAPIIPVSTAKRGDGMVRWIPVPRISLHEWIDYIKTTRKIILHKAGIADHDRLFVNLHTGAPLSVNTLGNIVHDLKGEAGIKEKASPHMFRHRFITEKVKALIEEFDMENEDVLRKALINSSTLKLKLQQWTGHVLLESLDRYIHIAFDEITNYRAVEHKVFESAERREYQERTASIMRDLRDGHISSDDAINMMEELLQVYFQGIDEPSVLH